MNTLLTDCDVAAEVLTFRIFPERPLMTRAELARRLGSTISKVLRMEKELRLELWMADDIDQRRLVDKENKGFWPRDRIRRQVKDRRHDWTLAIKKNARLPVGWLIS